MTTSDPAASLGGDTITLMVVAAEEPVRAALERFLVQERFGVETAGTADEADAALTARRWGCVVIDEQVPGELAPTLVTRLRARQPDLGVLVLRPPGAPPVPGETIEHLEKPVDPGDLLAGVRQVLRRRDALLEGERLHERLRQEVAIRTAELQRERENLQRLSVATLEALVNALEAKDPHLRGHSTRVADLAGRVAAVYGLGPEAVEAVRTAGRLHDIGKIGVREPILNKSGPLTDDEFEHIKTHAALGAQILAPLTHLAEVLGYVRHHHERWDGTGYPDGLRGEAIPVGARIIGAIEVYDALTTSRPYQEMMTPAAAVARLRELVGTVVDPRVHQALARVVEGAEG
jgi:putative two-component system response regulator